jgi:hypothetical protein
MLARSDYRFLEFSVTYYTNCRQSISWINFTKCIKFSIRVLDFIITFGITCILSVSRDDLFLFLFQSFFVFFLQLVSRFVVTSVMNENTCVASPTIPMLVVIFAPLRIMIDSVGAAKKSWRFHRTLESPAAFF